MNPIIEHGIELGRVTVAQRSKQISSRLRASLPPRLTVNADNNEVAISGPGLSAEIIANPDLRDVAFLMRGVR
ncbi:MAG: hypothetical protein U5J78_00390 [Parasphingorhabdus sp.]|nr:hypothetical protein [Parasphingorhabdus sp.]